MLKLDYKGNTMTVNELSEISGIKPATIRSRLRKGYSVEQAVQISPIHDSVIHFCEVSWYQDWIDTPMCELYQLYYEYCINYDYEPLYIQNFSMQVMKMYPQLRVVSKRLDRDGKCMRVITER